MYGYISICAYSAPLLFTDNNVRVSLFGLRMPCPIRIVLAHGIERGYDRIAKNEDVKLETVPPDSLDQGSIATVSVSAN